jgi:hypothetical protein
MAYGARAIRSCTSITITGGYPKAVRFFEETKPSRSRYWGDDERPLYKVSTHHYRLVRGPNADYYDVTLYNTPMLRLLRPEADGTHEMHLRAHGTSASREFMWQVCGFDYAPVFDTPEGDKVHVPLACAPAHCTNRVGDVPQGFSARIVLDGQGRLLRDRSAHYLTYTKVMSDTDKQARADLVAELTPYIDMLMLRLSYLHANRVVRRSWRAGKPFASADYGRHVGVCPTLRAGEVGDVEFKYMEMLAQAVYNQMMETQNYRDGATVTPIKLPNFRANYVNTLLKLQGLGGQSGKRALGSFPIKMPQRYSFF